MTLSTRWEQWDGVDFPDSKLNSIVYFFPGKVDIEEHEHIEELINTIHQDGIAPSKGAARALLEAAVVVHGRVIKDLDELEFYAGDSIFDRNVSEATWVELDEYSD